jgi:hypothetical protein
VLLLLPLLCLLGLLLTLQQVPLLLHLHLPGSFSHCCLLLLPLLQGSCLLVHLPGSLLHNGVCCLLLLLLHGSRAWASAAVCPLGSAVQLLLCLPLPVLRSCCSSNDRHRTTHIGQ